MFNFKCDSKTLISQLLCDRIELMELLENLLNEDEGDKTIERKDYNYEKTTSTNLYSNAFERKS